MIDYSLLYRLGLGQLRLLSLECEMNTSQGAVAVLFSLEGNHCIDHA